MTSVKPALFLVALVAACATDPPPPAWVVVGGGPASDLSTAVSLDNAGNAYVAGWFERAFVLGTTEVPTKGLSDAFVFRLDREGKTSWIFSGGGRKGDQATSVAASPQGTICLAGQFDDPAPQNAARFGDIELVNRGWTDIFVGRLDATGTPLWFVSAGGPDLDEANGVAADADGNCYIIGTFRGTAVFGDLSLTALGDSGAQDLFISKIDAKGKFDWAVRAGGLDGEKGKAIAVGASGNVFVTGGFSQTATFGPTTLKATTEFDHQLQEDVFVAKLDAGGRFLWTVAAGGLKHDTARAIAVGHGDRTYIAGQHSSETSVFGELKVTASGDVFVAALDGEGRFQWVTTIEGQGNTADGIALGPDGRIHLAGTFVGTTVFGDSSRVSAGRGDVFTVSLDQSGNIGQVLTAGGPEWNRSAGISVDNVGQPRIVGGFAGAMTFDDTTLVSTGENDIFVWSPRGP